MFSSSERMREREAAQNECKSNLLMATKLPWVSHCYKVGGGGCLAFGSYMETMWCGSNIKKWLTSKGSQRVDFVPNLVYRPMDEIIGLML